VDEINTEVTTEPVIESAPAPVETTEALSESPEPEASAPAPKPEKMIPKSQVNSIAAKAAARARAEVEAKYAQQQQQMQSEDVLSGLEPEQRQYLQSLVAASANELVKQRETLKAEQEGQRIVEEFSDKINDAMSQDPEFIQLYEDMNIGSNPLLVKMLNETDEMTDVMKELGTNPAKYSSILTLVNAGSEKLAQKQLHQIALSIKANKAAAQQKNAPEPLSQVKPSRTSALSDGKPSVASFMNNPRFRG